MDVVALLPCRERDFLYLLTQQLILHGGKDSRFEHVLSRSGRSAYSLVEWSLGPPRQRMHEILEKN